MITDNEKTGQGNSHSSQSAVRLLSYLAITINIAALLVNIYLLVNATTYTNIASIVIYFPALGLEALLLIPITIVAVCREPSKGAVATMFFSLCGGMGIIVVGAFINLICGARW